MSPLRVSGLGLLVGFLAALQGYDGTIRITANLVQVDAVVTDGRDRHVTDLDASDFEILQDGKPQKATHCTYIRTGPAVAAKAVVPSAGRAPVGPLPPALPQREQVRRTVAVIVDDLGLSFESVARVRRALNRFIDEQVQPWDAVAIIRTSGDVGALQQFTSDKRRLHAAAEGLRWYVGSRTGVCSFEPRKRCHPMSFFGVEPEIGRLSALGTLERLVFVVKGLAQLPGRKSILLFSEYIALPSDAEVSESATAVERAHERLLDAATRASAAFYSIDPRGLPILGYQSPASNKPVTVVFRGSQAGMGRLAEATGGEFLRDIDDLSIPIRVAMNDQQGYYSLEYEPDSSTFDHGTGQPKFHKIAVRVNRRGLKVRSHAGFEGIEDKRTTPAPGPMGAMIAALTSPFAGGDIEVGITSIFSNTAEQGSFFTATVYVKPGGLTLREEGEGRVAEGDIVRMVVDENGAVVDQPGITFRTKLSGADYERAMKDGWLYTLDVPVKKAGPYELRVAVRDNATGRIGTASQSVQAPDLQPERVALSGLMLQTLGTERAAGQDLRGSTARIFHPGETVTYSYQVLNPKLDKGTRRPKVEAQVNLYRDGKEPSTGRPVPMVVAADPTRLLASGALKIGLDMPAGEYVLEVVATDLLANVLGAEGYHNRTVAQYINFQVAP